VRAVRELRDAADAGHRRRCPSPKAAESRVPPVDKSTVRAVRLVLVQQPLYRLQHVGTGPHDWADTFLYDDSWMEEAGQGDIDKHGGTITLYPGVAAGLTETQLLLKPVIRHLWVEKVWRSNDEMFKRAVKIEEHLFGRQRLPLGTIGKGLKQAFGAECFYCHTRLETGGHVDHVLPWSITPIDGVANLVVSCQPCNTSKSDNLPAIHHVTRALKRPKATLQQIADADEADTEYERVRRAASNLYHRASANHTEVWQGIGDFIPLDLSSPPDWLLGG
jgi:5-methylcytosine-specific restriction endonuclease McrA